MGACKDCAFWEEFDGRCLKIGADMTLNDAPEIICNVSSKYEAKPEVKVHAFLSTPPDFGCTLFQRRFKNEKCEICAGSGKVDVESYEDGRGGTVLFEAVDCFTCHGKGMV